MKHTVLILTALFVLSSTATAQRRGDRDRGTTGDLINRLLICENEKRDLSTQLYMCRNNSNNVMWSCTAGCQGLGNVGFGSGRTEAEARAASLRDLGMTCSHHTFDCRRE